MTVAENRPKFVRDQRRTGGKDYQGHDENLGSDRYVHYLDYCDSFITVYIYVNISQLYTFNMGSFLYVNYTGKESCVFVVVVVVKDGKSHNPVGVLF